MSYAPAHDSACCQEPQEAQLREAAKVKGRIGLLLTKPARGQDVMPVTFVNEGQPNVDVREKV